MIENPVLFKAGTAESVKYYQQDDSDVFGSVMISRRQGTAS